MPLRDKWKKPRLAVNNGSATGTLASGRSVTSASLTDQTTNAEAGVYSGFARSATKEYGAEAVHILGMVAGRESSPYLTNKDRGFIRDMKDKMQLAGSGFVCSQGQVHWLRDLKDRLVENGEV